MTSVNRSGDQKMDMISSMTMLSGKAKEAKTHAVNKVDTNAIFKELGEIYNEFYETALDDKMYMDPNGIKKWDDASKEVIADKTFEFKESFMGAYALIKNNLSPQQQLTSKVWGTQLNKKCSSIIEATTKQHDIDANKRPVPSVPQNNNANVQEHRADRPQPPPKPAPKAPQNNNTNIVEKSKAPNRPLPQVPQNNNANVQEARGNKPQPQIPPSKPPKSPRIKNDGPPPSA